MHKKIIRDTVYFYTTIREKSGRTKTIYLGRTESEARKKEQLLKKKIGQKKQKRLFRFSIPFIVLIILLLFIHGGLTGNFAYSPNEIVFVFNDSWNISDVFVRVSLNSYINDTPAELLLKNSTIIVNLSEYDLNSTGTAYIDLFVGEDVVDSQTVIVSSAGTSEEENSSDSWELLNESQDSNNTLNSTLDDASTSTSAGSSDSSNSSNESSSWGLNDYTVQDTVTCVSCSDCSTAAATANRLVQLTQDVGFTGDGGCINLTASNVTFDCQGHVITGPLTSPDTEPLSPYNSPIYYGAWFDKVGNVTLKNCVIKGVYVGVVVEQSNSTLVFNNTFENIYSLNDSTGNNEGAKAIDVNTPIVRSINISYNTISGVYANHSYWDSGDSKWVGFNAFGIVLENIIIGGVVANNIISDFRCQSSNSDCKSTAIFYAGGSQPSDFFQDVVSKNNLIENLTSYADGGLSIGVMVADANLTATIMNNTVRDLTSYGANTNEAGYIIMTTADKSFVNLTGNTVINASIGFYAAYSSDHLIEGNTAINTSYGYYADTSSNWTLKNNEFRSTAYGLYLSGDAESTFNGNFFYQISSSDIAVTGNSHDLNFTDALNISNLYVESGSNLTVKQLRLGNSITYANFTDIFINDTVDTVQDPSSFEFSTNSFNLSSTANPGLNKSATIVFSQVIYTSLNDYDIIKDGIVCGTAQGCTKLTYDPVSFSVTGFSNYTTQGEVGCSSCSSCDAAASNPNTRITLLQDISMPGDGVCINFTADNITFDCQGHSITGPLNTPGVKPSSSSSEYMGIKIKGANNITITGCTVQNFYNGISVEGTNLTRIENNTIQHIYSVNETNFDSAIAVVISNPSASNFYLVDNNITDVRSKYQIWDSGNLVGFDAFGIFAEKPITNGTIVNNTITNVHCESDGTDYCKGVGFAFGDSDDVKFDNNVIGNITSNAPSTLVAGVAMSNDINYMKGEIKNNYINLVNSTASSADQGTAGILSLGHPTTYLDIFNNTINNSKNGFYLQGAVNYTITQNFVYNSLACYELLSNARNVSAINNTFDSCDYAIKVDGSSYSTFRNNSISDSALFDIAVTGNSHNITFEDVLWTEKLYVDQTSNLTFNNLRLGNSTTYINYTSLFVNGTVNTSNPNFDYGVSSLFTIP